MTHALNLPTCLIIAFAVGSFGCPDSGGSGSPESSEYASGRTLTASDEGESCTAGADTSALLNPAEKVRKDKDGTQITHIGAPFGAAQTVTVSALLTEPDALVGKRVRVRGDIGAMCHHKRGWFSLVAEDKSGRQVRVITAPTFLVPHGSRGKSAETEGVVEVIEVGQRMAQHLADDHKLQAPKTQLGPVKRVIIRATGADFF